MNRGAGKRENANFNKKPHKNPPARINFFVFRRRQSSGRASAHCCYSLHIFELGRNFTSIAHIEGGNFQPYFEDLNGDGLPEIKVADDFLAYQFSSFAYSAIADVILQYSEGTYKVSADLMKKPLLDLDLVDKKIRSWQKKDFVKPPPVTIRRLLLFRP